MMRLIVLVILCTQFIAATALQAQSYSSVRYDTKDGLPSATVYSITQDKDGFIWFGTENGLSRFDGKNFKTFTTKDGLPDNSILSVHGDNQGKVYFTPFTHGLYYYKNGNFHKVVIPDKLKSGVTVVERFSNKKDKVFFTSNRWYFLKNDTVVVFSGKFPYPNPLPLAHRIIDTLIVASSEDSIYYWPDTGSTRTYARPRGKVLVFDETGQMTKVNVGSTFDNYLSGNFVFNHTDQFLNIYDLLNPALIHRIRVEKFSNAFIDNENNLWVTTLGNGVFRFPSFGFRNLAFDQKSEIFSIAKINDRLIAGTDFSKMYEIRLNDKSSEYSVTDFFELIARSDNTVAHISKRNRIYVLQSVGDNIYIGADAFLLKKNKSSAPVFRNIFPVKDIDIADSKILVCTGHAALLLDDESFSIKDTLLNQRSTCGVIYHDNYYVGTIGGLIKISSADKKNITELNSLFPPFRSRITAIKKGIDDDLWIATSGSGLVHFKDDKIIRVYKEQDAITSDICTSLFIDSNVVWLGTNKGLNRIETGKEKTVVTRFTSANGLGADFINTILATDSNVCVGTVAGLTIFNKNILTEKSICVLQVLGVSENNKLLNIDSSYSFPYNALNIQIDFTAISFKSAGDIVYSYQLQGLDNSWNTTTANFVNFPTLQPNNYTLLLKAENKFGVKSKVIAIHIKVKPPWWQTWFFRVTALIVIALLVLVVYRYNIRNIRRKEEMKREFEARFSALEQKALQAQINPHFIFNSLNSIQTFILDLDVEGANNYLTNFASLIRQTLENSMHPLITISSELKYLETYLSLEKLRFREKFRYTISVDEAIDQNTTFLPGMLLQPYIENSMRHGIQHRKDSNGIISLTINKTTDNSIIYTIKDNGVGRKRAEELKSSRHIEYQSRGTSINEKRIAAINNQFKTTIRVNTDDGLDENGMVAGTVVTVVIPPFLKM